MLKNILFITTMAFATTAFMTPAAALATSSAVVNKSSCSKLAKTTQPFMLILDSGDELVSSITQCAKDAKLKGAALGGLGQLQNPTLAYFSSDPHDKPALTTFPGFYELASLSGNVAVTGNQYFTHVHAVLADKKFQGVVGHLDSAKVGLTVEITIVPFSAPVQRTVDPETGFGPIVH